MRFFPNEKLEALATFATVDLTSIRVWSDNSMTIGSSDWIEYYVTKRKRTNGHLLGRQDGFYIYVNHIEIPGKPIIES
ncbi:hypothetical protein SAMN03159341_12270 [Paenibacillus sp. 1_12]|nr:hypothetical protein SAMN03159341_12270 [Paenibacillus sp. 1_12]